MPDNTSYVKDVRAKVAEAKGLLNDSEYESRNQALCVAKLEKVMDLLDKDINDQEAPKRKGEGSFEDPNAERDKQLVDKAKSAETGASKPMQALSPKAKEEADEEDLEHSKNKKGSFEHK